MIDRFCGDKELIEWAQNIFFRRLPGKSRLERTHSDTSDFFIFTAGSVPREGAVHVVDLIFDYTLGLILATHRGFDNVFLVWTALGLLLLGKQTLIETNVVFWNYWDTLLLTLGLNLGGFTLLGDLRTSSLLLLNLHGLRAGLGIECEAPFIILVEVTSRKDHRIFVLPFGALYWGLTDIVKVLFTVNLF